MPRFQPEILYKGLEWALVRALCPWCEFTMLVNDTKHTQMQLPVCKADLCPTARTGIAHRNAASANEEEGKKKGKTNQ